MSLFSAVKNIVKGTNSAYNFLSGFNSLLTGDTKTNELEEKVTNSETWPLPSGRFMEQNEIMKRFHMGNEYGTEMNSEIFSSGFEDPTRLMFKVEFGDWGCSVLDTETIKNQQKTSLFNNIYYEDYDQYPMGLLNLNFLNFDRTENWSNQEHYNTYNYLMNRNEDARASYIKTFVKGLYEIQRSMPYLFKKISGLEKLTSFDATKGVRLKDAKITLECYEGVDLKIRTLLEMYRKAAYDDVWQRWILPDIYRYFKMIIYVFDRRILQTGYKLDKSTGDKVAVYSVDQNNFPIYALECGPCEFDIESIWDNEYATAYDEHKDAETKITISVKNVKTYYSNGLMKKIDTLDPNQDDNSKKSTTSENAVNWISDFDSITEKGSYTSTDFDNHANFRTRWMRRMFMTPSEYTAYFDKEITHKVGDNSDYDRLYGMADVYGPQLPDNTWHMANVRDSLYSIQSWKDLKKYLKKVIHSRPVLVRDSANPDRDTFYNDLQRPNEESYIYDHEQLLYGPDVIKAQEQMKNRIKVMIQYMLHNTYVVGSDAYYNIVDPGIIDTSTAQLDPNIKITGDDASFILIDPCINMNLDKIQHNYIRPNENLDKIKQNYQELDMNLDKPQYDYISPEFNLNHNDMTYVEPEMNLDKPDQTYVIPEFNLDKPDQDYIKPEMNLDKFQQNYVRPDMNLDHNLMNYIKPYMNLDKPDQNYVEPEMNLDHDNMTYVVPEFNLDKPDQDYIKPEMNLDKPDQNYVSPDMNLNKPDQNYVEPKMNLDHADMNYVKPKMNLDHTDMNYVSPDMNTEHNSMTYVKPEMDISKSDMTYVELNIDTSHNSMTYVKPQLDSSHNSMTYVKPEMNLEHTKMDMKKDSTYFDTSKVDMNFMGINIDSSHNGMNFISVPQDAVKNKMNLIPNPQNVSKEHHNLQPLEGDDIPQAHNQMVEMDMYLTKTKMDMIPNKGDDTKFTNQMFEVEITGASNGQMKMTPMDISTSKIQMDMAYLNTSTSLGDMTMTSIKQNVSTADMDMTYLNASISLPDMDMTYINTSTSLGDMDMTYLDMNVSTTDMKMTYPELNTSLPDMIMVKPNEDISLADMDMTYLDMNVSTADMKFTELTDSSSLSNMVMTELINDTSLSNMVMSKPIDNTSILDMKMFSPEIIDSSLSMVMTQPVYNDYQQNMVMTEPLLNESKIDMQMTQPILNSSTNNIPMVNNHYNNSYDTSNMKMPSLNTSTSVPTSMIFDNIIENPSYNPEMKMVKISQEKDKQLFNKIKALTSINTDELKDTNIQQLVSLADVIESTYDELRNRHRQHMKMQDNIPDIPKHKHMTMTKINQGNRNTYLVSNGQNFVDVDDNAKARAWQAKQEAQSDNKSKGNNGYAI